MHISKSLVFVFASVCLCIAKGGGGGRGGGGGGGRGFSGARSSVGSSSSHSSSSGTSGSSHSSISAPSPGRSSFSSAAKGAAVGGAVGFAAGVGTHAMLSSHTPIIVNHNTYYWGHSYAPSQGKGLVACTLNITDDPIFTDLDFDNSTDNSTRPETVVWECPKGRCDLVNMECREERSTLITAIIIIVIIISLTIFCVTYSRMRKQCSKRSGQRRRQDYEVESRGGGPVDGMAPLPKTPMPNRDPEEDNRWPLSSFPDKTTLVSPNSGNQAVPVDDQAVKPGSSANENNEDRNKEHDKDFSESKSTLDDNVATPTAPSPPYPEPPPCYTSVAGQRPLGFVYPSVGQVPYPAGSPETDPAVPYGLRVEIPGNMDDAQVLVHFQTLNIPNWQHEPRKRGEHFIVLYFTEKVDRKDAMYYSPYLECTPLN